MALAMSREEAEQEETKLKSDDMRLQLALQKSKESLVKQTAIRQLSFPFVTEDKIKYEVGILKLDADYRKGLIVR